MDLLDQRQIIWQVTESMTDTIKDRGGRKIAFVTDEGESLRMRDANYRTIGWYSKTRDITMTSSYKIVGPGNQLSRLIPAR